MVPGLGSIRATKLRTIVKAQLLRAATPLPAKRQAVICLADTEADAAGLLSGVKDAVDSLFSLISFEAKRENLYPIASGAGSSKAMPPRNDWRGFCDMEPMRINRHGFDQCEVVKIASASVVAADAALWILQLMFGAPVH